MTSSYIYTLLAKHSWLCYVTQSCQRHVCKPNWLYLYIWYIYITCIRIYTLMRVQIVPRAVDCTFWPTRHKLEATRDTCLLLVLDQNTNDRVLGILLPWPRENLHRFSPHTRNASLRRYSRCHLSLSPKYQSQISSDPEGSQLFLAASLQDKRRPQGTGFLAWSQTSRASV